MVHHDRHADVVVSTTPAARHAANFNGMMIDTSDVAVVGIADMSTQAVPRPQPFECDAWSPMGVALTIVANGSRLCTPQAAKHMMSSLRCNGFTSHI